MSDLISRQDAIDAVGYYSCYSGDKLLFADKPLKALPSVENKGEWIYDMSIYNWRCSRCGQTLPPTGYVGTAEFMAKHFKFCNHCGAKMKGGSE